ncbi:putative F-box protein At1g49610 [Cannabis sativa]|uniref:putative F-box protein At1g49610 n=1 Tax=Cannabis sativa TaxID=3483 RepID=UPI0029C9DEDC|nr:putative F-box protein At1g49610 [Cannabis sativa]
MAEKRAKTALMMMGEEEDRISELPDSLIQHILSFLSTKDAVSTCLVSNRWKLMWYSVSELSFSDFDWANSKKFYNYVNNYLERRKRGNYFILDSAITSFKLHMTNSYQRRMARDLDKWLAFIVEKKVKEINLRVNKQRSYRGDIHYYSLPKTLAVNARYLTTLILNSVELDSRYSFSFPSLKTLTLACVRLVGNDAVDKLLMGSPSLEKLQLHFCCFSTDTQFRISIQHSLSLKFLDIKLTKDLVERIALINLESLYLASVSFDKIKLSACKAIRILNLTCCWGKEESSSLEYLISNLPLLEKLTLCKWKLEHIEISNQHLENLSIHNSCHGVMNVVIKSTPKLTTFIYVGDVRFRMSMESSNLLFGIFVIKGQENYDIYWFINLMNFLLNLNCSWRCIDIHVKSEEALMFPDILKRVCRSPLVNWKHLRFFTECKPERESDLKNALQWISPTLSIMKRRLSKRFFKL